MADHNLNPSAEGRALLKHALRRPLGLHDLVLAQILSVVGITWIGIAAALGRAQALTWIAAMWIFYLPTGAVVIYLNREMPLEGGIYRWAKGTFGVPPGFWNAIDRCVRCPGSDSLWRMEDSANATSPLKRSLGKTTRVGIFGWGVVAPKSPNIEAFKKNLSQTETWLSPFEGFGPNNFLAGEPEFDFNTYKSWIDARFAPRHFQNLKEKMEGPSLYAIGAFIQALGQNPGLEPLLQQLGSQAQVYIGTGLGAIDASYQASIHLYKTQLRWDAFWANPAHNSAVAAHQASEQQAVEGVPPSPESLPAEQREDALAVWNAFWMARSPELELYLAEAAEIDNLSIEGDVDKGKLNILREKSKRHARLQEKWGSPEPPWKVSAHLIWNIHNTPAAQVSILGKITGLAFAPVAACSTFGVALRLAMQAIQSGDAKAVVIGATDPAPHPLTVGSFYGARVLSAGRRLSNPLTQFQGTHISGGSVVWIVGDMEYMKAKGFRPLGMEPIAVGVSSDAHHIITPSMEGPKLAIEQALAEADAQPRDIETWDVHATATPGDYSEMTTFRLLFPDSVLVTARKGTFGHGMSAGSGWELTAQYLGYEQGQLFPTSLEQSELNPEIRDLHRNFVFAQPCPVEGGLAGKLSMGIGGINACVISRPLDV